MIVKNGTEMQVKVLEISPTQISYKKQDNPGGPVYNYPVRDVLLIKYANGTKDVFGKQAPGLPDSTDAEASLTYKRGLFSSHFVSPQGARLSGTQTRSILAGSPAALSFYQRGKALRVGGYLTTAAGVAMIGGGLAAALLGREESGAGEHQGQEWLAGKPGDEGGFDGHHHGEHHNGDNSEAGYVIAGAGVLTGLVGIWLDHRATVNFRRAADAHNASGAASLHFGPSRTGLGLAMALKF